MELGMGINILSNLSELVHQIINKIGWNYVSLFFIHKQYFFPLSQKNFLMIGHQKLWSLPSSSSSCSMPSSSSSSSSSSTPSSSSESSSSGWSPPTASWSDGFHWFFAKPFYVYRIWSCPPANISSSSLSSLKISSFSTFFYWFLNLSIKSC